MRTVAEEQPEGQKYCAEQTNGRSGENVYDEGTEVANGLMPIKHAAGPRYEQSLADDGADASCPQLEAGHLLSCRSVIGSSGDGVHATRKSLMAKVEDVEPRAQSTQSHLTLLDVYRNPELRTNFLVLCVMWFCAALSMYMIDLNGEDMTKNFWLGQYLSGALASIIRIIVGLADSYLPWLGRRKVYIISMSTCIVASIGLTAQLYAGEKGSTFYFVTYLTAYNSISVAWEPNFLGAAELMPTDVRAKSTALLNIISRLASVLASQMIYFKTIYEPAIMIVLIISNIFSFVVATTYLKVSCTTFRPHFGRATLY
ncbi:unnamed protein product [Heligmosomoides polygyrus]|uniref:MFS domain-containing protein n=1 Tax=Heligmosomoides polygyrus TaxID=6339 RepID=A0A183GIP4_HELPZ|nr:unnamed protein product [Heligmosomoides polygyrus]